MNIDDQRKIKSLIQACKIEEVIEILDKLDVEINLDGGTPFVIAASSGCIDLVKYLFDRGANVNAMRDGKYTALTAVLDQNDIDIDLVQLLLSYGADVNIKDSYGNDALFKAVDTYDLNIVKMVVEAGSNPFVGDNPENYSSYDSARDIEANEIVDYFDSLKEKYT